MKQEKTIKELLELMLLNQPLYRRGLCSWCDKLHWDGIIDRHEHKILYAYIEANPPKIKGFFARIFMPNQAYFYWKPQNIARRIKWLKKHIKKNTK